ncbi:hypothetical protein KDL29_10960 [bacterium]|nr:hypothetical protein [bacterium]
MRAITVTLAILLLATTSALAEVAPVDHYERKPEWMEHGYQVMPPEMMQWLYIDEAVKAYYKVFGKWPQQYADIQAAGLFRAELSFRDGIIATPDDGPPEEYGDFQYVYRGEDEAPLIVRYAEQLKLSDAARENNNLQAYYSGVGMPVGVSQYEVYSYQGEHRMYEDPDEEWMAWCREHYRNTDVYKLLAIASMSYLGAIEFQKATGRIPRTWQEFQDSGYSPLTADMLNPVTGRPFVSDGSPFSIEFHPISMDYPVFRNHDMQGNVTESSTDGHFSVRVIGIDGKPILPW